MTPSAGRPLRVATLDVQAVRLERATRRILLAAGVHHVLALAAADPRHFGERAQALRDARADVVLVPVADRSGADGLVLLAEPLRFGCAAQRPPPRVILACDDDGGIARATGLLAPFAIERLPDVRTDQGRAQTVARLRELRRGEGKGLPDERLEELARSVVAARGGSTLVVDVSSSSTSLVRAEGSALVAVHARPLGTGAGADHVVARAGLDRVRRWIPWAVDQPTLLERVFNRARWPAVASSDRSSRAVEVALAHEAVAHALDDATAAGVGALLRSADHIVLTGRLAALSPGEGLLVAIDGLEPREAVSVLREEEDGSLTEVAGALPVATSRRAVVRISAQGVQREERVDRGAFYVIAVRGPVEVDGGGIDRARIAVGALGLVVDARPRPLALPARDAERVPAVTGWYSAVGALPAELAGAEAVTG